MTEQTFVPILTVMVDYGNAPFLWVKHRAEIGGVGPNLCDGSFWDESFPISECLWRKFADWAIEFDSTCFDESGFSEGWDWSSYHSHGLELSRLLKNEVRDRYRVVYQKPYEDVASRSESGIEVELVADSPLSRGRKHPSFRPENLLTESEVEALLNDAKDAHQKARQILGYESNKGEQDC